MIGATSEGAPGFEQTHPQWGWDLIHLMYLCLWWAGNKAFFSPCVILWDVGLLFFPPKCLGLVTTKDNSIRLVIRHVAYLDVRDQDQSSSSLPASLPSAPFNPLTGLNLRLRAQMCLKGFFTISLRGNQSFLPFLERYYTGERQHWFLLLFAS